MAAPTKVTVYLAIRADGAVRVLKKRPAPMWGEFIVRLTLKLPDMMPMKEVDLTLPGGEDMDVELTGMKALPPGQ
jgi:hypothetical protein